MQVFVSSIIEKLLVPYWNKIVFIWKKHFQSS